MTLFDFIRATVHPVTEKCNVNKLKVVMSTDDGTDPTGDIWIGTPTEFMGNMVELKEAGLLTRKVDWFYPGVEAGTLIVAIK